MLRLFSFLVLLTVFTSSFAQVFESTEKPTALVELYTSEGCSSCPPADRWLSSLKDDEGLWKEFVPLAFHVDYWDYIGWEDRFADKQYSQRQRRYAHEFSEPTVYTPGIRWAGHEWRAWRRGVLPQSTPIEKSAVLTLSVDQAGEFIASYADGGGASKLNIAILGSGLETKVERGENRGHTLKHDFVVLHYQVLNPSSAGQWRGSLTAPEIDAARYAVAVWVSDGSSQLPLQATGGYLSEHTWTPES